MASNKVYVQGSYVDVHDNEVVNLSIDKAGKVSLEKANPSAPVTQKGLSPLCREALADAVEAVQAHMWGAAAYAVCFVSIATIAAIRTTWRSLSATSMRLPRSAV